MEAKVINLQQIRREKTNKKSLNETKINQTSEISLGHVGFDIFMFINLDSQVDLGIDSDINISINPKNDSDDISKHIIKITPNIDVNNKLMSKKLFISFCKFIKSSLPNIIQIKQDDKKKINKNFLNEKVIEEKFKTILGYIGFDLFICNNSSNESKIFLKPTIKLDEENILDDDFFTAYCETIKKQLPALLDNFIETIESEK